MMVKELGELRGGEKGRGKEASEGCDLFPEEDYNLPNRTSSVHLLSHS